MSISTARPSPGARGALPNHKNPWLEPPDHAIGRSRGGLTTKLHLVADGRGRPLGDDQIAHRRKNPGRPIDFGNQQQERYKGRNVVERCFNKLKQWRGTAMRSDNLARSYRAAISLVATLTWIKTYSINTA